MRRRCLIAVLACIAAVALGGCGSGGGGGGGNSGGNGGGNAGGGTSISAVSLSAPTETVLVGQTLQLTPAATNSSGTAVSVPAANYSYASSAPGVATVNANGLVTGVAPGTTTITVTESSSHKQGAIGIVVTTATGGGAVTVQ